MSAEREHGSDLWPPSFRGLNLQAEIQVATQLGRQSSYLRSRPFIHSASNLNKIIERLDADEEDEFGWSLSFDPAFIARLATRGFLPMAGQCFADLICLLPKLHQKRCVMVNLAEGLKVPRGAMKRSRHYDVTVDQAFDEVIAAIQVQHGESCWFYAPLTKAYREIHAHNNDISFFGVRMHSIELWQPEIKAADGALLKPKRLVAGELGYTVGGSYTSLSGFRLHDADGAGTVQCCVLAKVLNRCGFSMWDLGMGMAYKYDLGAVDVPRNVFLGYLASASEPAFSTCVLSLEDMVPVSAEGLLKGSMSAPDGQKKGQTDKMCTKVDI